MQPLAHDICRSSRLYMADRSIKCVSLICLNYISISKYVTQQNNFWRIHVRFAKRKKWKMAQNEMLQNKIIPYNHLLSFRQILFSSLTQNIVIIFIALLFEARAWFFIQWSYWWYKFVTICLRISNACKYDDIWKKNMV